MHKEINDRLRAGALAILVEDADEVLALASAQLAAKMYQPLTVKSAADQDVMDTLASHKTNTGTLILLDFIRTYGSSPVATRMIREVAIQQPREDGKPCGRLIMIELPGTEIPPSLRGDIEYVIPKLPDVADLRTELDSFVKQQDVKVDGNGEARQAIANSVSGLARHEANRLYARCYVEKGKMDPIWLRTEKAHRVSERLGGALSFLEVDGAAEVGGLEVLKDWLAQRRDAFGSDKAKKFGLPEPKGMLLLGIPGTGKSLTAKTVAASWGLPLLRLDVGKVFGSLVGQSESQIRQAIEAAEACAPCVMWLDELEKALASGGLDGGTSQRVFATMLTWLQEKTKPVFVIATANDISSLPPELLRKGRFDEIFFVDLPGLKERTEIASIHLKRRNRPVAEARKIAEATEGFSGSEIEQAVIEGLFTAFAAKRDLKTEDVLNAVRGTVPLSKTMEDKIKTLRSWANGRAKLASKPEQAVIRETLRRGEKVA